MIITSNDNYRGFDEWLIGKTKVFMVCDESIRFLEAFNKKLNTIRKTIIRFSDFRPNPTYDSVVKGVEVYRNEGCDSIIAVGGGSAIDVAKCIKLYSNLDGDGADGAWLKKSIIPNSIPFLAMPTTAGTGSEATRYAVVYYEGEKQSITSESIIPETVLMDPDVLRTLPLYQKKATMCDALCHAIESYWSINSTEDSKNYSRLAIQTIIEHMDGYLANTDKGREGMLRAANIAGKAINISQTTAGHAMCYKISSIFGVAHGHAAILCDRVLYSWMNDNSDRCIDPRGESYFRKSLEEIGNALGCDDAKSGAKKLMDLFNMLDLEVPTVIDKQYDELVAGVNPVRLKNNPVALDDETINILYHEVFKK